MPHQCGPRCSRPCRLHICVKTCPPRCPKYCGPVYQNLDPDLNYPDGDYPSGRKEPGWWLEADPRRHDPNTFYDGDEDPDRRWRGGARGRGLPPPRGGGRRRGDDDDDDEEPDDGAGLRPRARTRGLRGGGGGGDCGGEGEREGCWNGRREGSIIQFLIGFAVFVIALMIAYFAAGDEANPQGCDQTDDMQRLLCDQSQRATGAIDQVKVLIVLAGVYLVIGIIGMLRWWNPATVALAFAGVILLIMAIYRVAISPTNSVRTAGAGWIVACFIIILLLWWAGSILTSGRRGWGCCQC
jgi:hypothetical protein